MRPATSPRPFAAIAPIDKLRVFDRREPYVGPPLAACRALPTARPGHPKPPRSTRETPAVDAGYRRVATRLAKAWLQRPASL